MGTCAASTQHVRALPSWYFPFDMPCGVAVCMLWPCLQDNCLSLRICGGGPFHSLVFLVVTCANPALDSERFSEDGWDFVCKMPSKNPGVDVTRSKYCAAHSVRSACCCNCKLAQAVQRQGLAAPMPAWRHKPLLQRAVHLPPSASNFFQASCRNKPSQLTQPFYASCATIT